MTNNDLRPNGSRELPVPIVEALRRLIRRARQLIVIRGLCAACAAGIGAFLAVMMIDAGFTLLARWPRWLMTVAAYGVWAGALFWFLVRPLARSFTLTGIARLIETQHPELHERLSSVVELLGSRDLPAIRGSEVLIGALTEEAVRDAAKLRPKHEISFRSAIPFAVAAGLVVALLAGLWVALPRQTRFLLARAAAPFLNLPNVHAADLVVEPGDTQVASGSTLRISIRTANAAVTSCRLRQLDRRGREIVTDMAAIPGTDSQTGRVFSVLLPDVVAGFRYRIHAGDAVTRYFTVRVAIPPVIRHLDIRCRHPDYSGLGTTQTRDGSGTIRALAGSEVTVSAGVNKPVAAAAMRVMAATATNTFEGVARQAGGELAYDFSLTLPKRLNGRWTLVLADEIGLSNAPFEYAIQSIPDNPPVPAIVNLRQRELRLNREARLPVAYAAEDDLGLTGLALVFTVNGGSNETLRSLPLPTQAVQGVKAMQGEVPLAMDDPLFDGVARVTFRLRAVDNLPASLGGPQYGHSDTVTIILDERAVAWKEQVLTSQEERVRQGLTQAQQKLAAARDQARALQAPLAQQAALSPESVRKIDSMQDALAAADNSLRELAADVEKGFFAALATNLAALADQHVGKAENLAGQLRLVDRPAERAAIHSNVTAEIDSSLGAVERAIQAHELARAAVRRAVELDRLAEKQATLAEMRQEQERAAVAAASNAAASLAADVEAWQRAQDQVADQLGGLARQTPGTPEQVAVAASNLAVQTAREAAALATRQEELAAMTRQQAEQLLQQEGAWRELAGRQEQLAALARRDPVSAPRSPPMQQAAAELAAGQLGPSLETQAQVADGLRQDAERLLDPAVAAGTPGAGDPVDPGRAAAESLQKAEGGLKAARQAAEDAGQAAREAEKRAASDAALVKRAQGVKNPVLAREFSMQAELSRQDAGEARRWSQAAAQAADLAGRAAVEARQAAEQAGRQAQPESARRDAAERAERAAEKTGLHAEDARAAAHQAAAKSVGRGSPQDRAVQAEERALASARDAAQSAVKAGVAAEQARQEAEQAVKRAEQAVMSGSAPPQAQAAGEKAAEARARARAAAEAASKSREESVSASQEARAAQQAADRALRGGPPMTARENAEAAEHAAEAARQAAARAADQARLADEAAGPPRSSRERTAQAAERADWSAAQAEQAAAAAQEAAQATAKPVAEARRLVELAWGTGQNDLAQQAGQKALRAREQAARAAALADAARQSAAAARQAATKAVDAGKEAGPSSADRGTREAEESARQAGAEADRARDLARQAVAAAGPDPAATAVAGDAREAARQAQSAAQIAQQSAQTAQQAVQKATAAAQGTEQQAAEAAQGARQAAQTAEQAVQQAGMSRGKADEADKQRRAEGAQQKAQLAGQHEAAAKRAAQLARQVEQQAQQAARLSARSAQAAQQAAQMAQQAAQQAGMEAGRAALAAVEKTRESTDAAARANALAERARELLAGLNVARLASQQEDLRRETAGLLAGKAAAGKSLRAALSERLGQQQRALAEDAGQLARDVESVAPDSPAVPPAVRAAEAASRAAAEWEKGALPAARGAAADAAGSFNQLAEALRAATPPSAEVPSPAAERLQRASDLAARQDRLGRQMDAVDGDRLLGALQGQQEAMSREIEALAQAASVVQAQTDQVLARTQAVPKTGQAVREMDQAAQSAGQAARQMEPLARQGERLEGAAAPVAPAASRNAAQAAERIRQAQQGAAQSLQQAARTLESAVQAMASPATPGTPGSRPAAADGEALAAAYGHARQAAAGRSADEAARAAGELARAAGQAVAEAQALGANARPATLEAAAGGGGGRQEDAQASEDIPSFARRLGIRLQDWLRLHGELKEDVLQAAGSEGPEEYRPLIKRYFREVSSHGGEE